MNITKYFKFKNSEQILMFISGTMLCGYYATTFLVQLIRLFDKHTGAKQ
jgi:hypothetical protein